MNLLDGKLYDPAAAVNKVTAALLAMTALDTTNLRLTVTVPPSGRILWRIDGTLHGATTMPQIMLGVLEGATIRGRASPMHGATNIAATSQVKVSAEGIITGLTPGASIVLDAAYGVETLVAATGLKYGGPNNTTANDNFGGLLFELWDPSPIYTPSSVPATPISARIDTIDDFVDTEIANIQGRLPAALVAGRMDASVGAMAADVITAAATAADFGTEVGTAVWASGARTLTANPGLDAAGVRAAVGLAAANLDTQLDALPTAAEVRVEIDANSTKLDVAVGTRMATFVYTAPDNASITAIKAKTDSLTFTVAGKLDVNVLVVNGVTLQGAGFAGDKWRPA